MSIRELSLPAIDGRTQAHHAVRHGHGSVLRVLHELGAGATLSLADADGKTPAHHAARHGHGPVLRVLHELGHGATLFRRDAKGRTPAHVAARHGHDSVLRVLRELGAGATLSRAISDGRTPAHLAARHGHDSVLRVLNELGAGATLSQAATDGRTPAHHAARLGHESVLRVLHELGSGAALSLTDENGKTPAHNAAMNGHGVVLRVLHELGAGGSFLAVDTAGNTPAHAALGAGAGTPDPDRNTLACLRALHAGVAAAVRPDIDHLQRMMPVSASADPEARRLTASLMGRLQDQMRLAITNSALETPAHLLARSHQEPGSAEAACQVDCLLFLADIGGLDGLRQTVTGNPSLLDAHAGNYHSLLSHPRLLGLAAKRAWLSRQLAEAVGPNAGAARLSLHAVRGSVLDGVCAPLGVDVISGAVVTHAGPLDVQFQGENGVGDGVRREWFGKAVAAIVDPDRGLFLSKDGGSTLFPNPHSALAAGADHLSYFALLGRIAGLALYHGEHIPAQCSTAFIKAAFGYRIVAEDMEAVDPELYQQRVVYIRDAVYRSRDGMGLADLDLTFEAEFNFEDYTAKGAAQPPPVELKPGGAGRRPLCCCVW